MSGDAPADALRARVAALLTEAGASGQRRGLVLAGPPARTGPALAAALALEPGQRVIWLGVDPPPPFEAATDDPRAVLGRQFDRAVLDLIDDCRPDMLGAIAGAVAGGGLLVVRVPPLADWRARAGMGAPLAVEGAPAPGARFAARLADVLGAAAGVDTVEWSAGCWRVAVGPPAPQPPSAAAEPFDDPDCLTADQARAVAAVLKVATGRRRRPVVLVADRGRGKSTALGIAAGRLVAADRLEGRGVAVIAPERAAVEPVFAHARRIAGDAVDGPGGLRFVAPAELAAEGVPPAGLIVVDEAAALPVAVLGQVLEGHPRVVFSTTVHGYEGTGRGFAIRFTGLLDRVRPHWRRLRLEAPIRYRAGDPIEAAVFRALLLDAAPVPDAVVAGVDPERLAYRPLDRARLAADEPRLRALFGLLVAAHYRTSPADLERLLDGPNVAVWAAEGADGAVVAAALVTREGGLEPALADAIHRGERRPTGHMLPETLAAHLGLAEAPRRVGWRVVRIAAHPAAWGRGVGSALLAAIAEGAGRAGVDYLGSAFGATDALLRFWARGGFAVARVGLTRGRSSGLHAAVVLRPLTPAGERLVAAARRRFAAQFPLVLGGALDRLEPTLAGRLVAGAPAPRPGFDADERAELALFADGRRVAGAVIDLLWRLAPWAVADPATPPLDRALLLAAVLQRRDTTAAGAAVGIDGRRAASRALGAAVARALERLDPLTGDRA